MQVNLVGYGQQHDFVHSNLLNPAMIGGIGTGKSRGAAMRGLRLSLEEPGTRGVITAPTYPMLRDATLYSWWEVCPRELVDWSASELVATFKHLGYRGGSQVMFRSTDQYDHLRGPNLAWGVMDEAGLSSYAAWRVLVGRMRLPGYRHSLAAVSTPRGYNWLWDLFGPEAVASHPDTRRRYQIPTFANPYLDLDYIKSLYEQYGGESQSSFFKQEVLGEFTSYEGLVYPEFRLQAHVGNYLWKPNRPTFLAVDFGYTNPYAVVALQTDSYGRIFVVDEEYRKRVTDEEMVELLRGKRWWGKEVDCVCDEEAPDRIARLARLGIKSARASEKGRIADGVAKMRGLLRRDDVLQSPFLLVDSHCKSTILEFGQYRYADPKPDRNVDENPVDAYNHALSAIRYFIVTRWSREASGRTADRSEQGPSRQKMAYD